MTSEKYLFQVQSRNRSIAELQVSGVRAASTIRPFDTSVTLSVHSLLLVDALQTFGRDFELLVASHKHVVYVLLLTCLVFFTNGLFTFSKKKNILISALIV